VFVYCKGLQRAVALSLVSCLRSCARRGHEVENCGLGGLVGVGRGKVRELFYILMDHVKF